ncbi:MAG: hypothetical protein K2K38_05225, partial [Clostridia bacterium]|nr:hypothetical protein [Clostridia bacterium]
MYGIYIDIIDAAERALDSFEETKELLEYPEVQADKAYYLSVLSKYNNLKFIKDKFSALISALEEEKSVSSLLVDAHTDEERAAIYEEISSLKTSAARQSSLLSEALGCKHVNERAYCKFKFKKTSSKFGTAFFSLIKSELKSRGAKIENEKTVTAKSGYVQEISFITEGADVITRLMPLTG